MEIIIKTAFVVVDDKPTPLTKKIVEQLPRLEGEFILNERFEDGSCKALGEVMIDHGRNEAVDYWILVATPKGVRKIDQHYKAAINAALHRAGKEQIERIILTK